MLWCSLPLQQIAIISATRKWWALGNTLNKIITGIFDKKWIIEKWQVGSLLNVTFYGTRRTVWLGTCFDMSDVHCALVMLHWVCYADQPSSHVHLSTLRSAGWCLMLFFVQHSFIYDYLTNVPASNKPRTWPWAQKSKVRIIRDHSWFPALKLFCCQRRGT